MTEKLHIHCDVIHPESGEVLAEPHARFLLPDPRGEHILAVAEAHPYHYHITRVTVIHIVGIESE